MKKIVLVLEDDVFVLKVVRQMLKQYTIIEARTAEEALLSFIDLNHQIDLLVADLTFPRMTGLQVALHLRTKLPKLPVIVISGHRVCSWKVRDTADLERLGPTLVTVLEKPCRPRALLDAVDDLMGRPEPAEVARIA
jgi:CheY-like chemotaxis protein